MLEPVQGEGGVQPSPPGYLEARARAVRRARGAARSSTRCRPGSAAPAGGSASSTPTACGPTSSPWPRRSATACRSARAGPAPRSPRRSSPATTPPPSAASRSPARAALDGARRDGRESTCPRCAARAGERAHARRCSTSPGVADVRGVGLLIAAELAPRHRRRAGRRRVPATPGWSSTRSRRPRCGSRRRCSSPTTRSTRRSRSSPTCSRGARRSGPHDAPADFLEVDDLTPAEFAAVLDARRAVEGRPVERSRSCSPGRASRCCSRSRRPAPACPPRWRCVSLGGHPIYMRPEEVGPRRARVGRRRRPHARRLLRGDRGAGVRPRHARGDGGGRRRPGRQPAVRPRAPVPGARRLPHPARAVRRRSRAGALAYVGDGNNVAASLAFAAALVGRRAHRRVAAGLRARRRHRRARPQPRRHASSSSHDPYEAVPGADAVYTDVWTSMGQEDEPASAAPRSPGYQVDAALMAAAGPSRRGSCTACPRTAARRSRRR